MRALKNLGVRATYGTAVHFPSEGVKANLQLLGGVSPHYMAEINSIYEVNYYQRLLQSVHRCEDGEMGLKG